MKIQNTRTAITYRQNAAEVGNPAALNDSGQCYFRGDGVPEDWAKAVELWSKGAARGHAGAQYNLAVCYLHGEHVR